MTNKFNYVVGFMLSHDRKKIVLIEKQKPDWQKMKLNGVGGKIEDKENPTEAMIREFKEETGCDTDPMNWECFAFVHDEVRGVFLHLFRYVDWYNDKIPCVKTMEKERIGVYFVSDLNALAIVPNLKVFVPMACNPDFIKADLLMALNG